MDIKYNAADWQALSEGVGFIESMDLFSMLKEADRLSEQAEQACAAYDADRAIQIDTPEESYEELANRFVLLNLAMRHIPDQLSGGVDYPFASAMDQVVEGISNMDLMGYSTSAKGYFPDQ
ncbi:hypothetical protein, partial [Enterococcus sp. LJL51]|uniref:hypothetical protein n=1 Tax=Enterococcus sp. LJL51 TaxID=3416656 RepID=UPI003CF271EF